VKVNCAPGGAASEQRDGRGDAAGTPAAVVRLFTALLASSFNEWRGSRQNNKGTA
jgi:hypothetical protein